MTMRRLGVVSVCILATGVVVAAPAQEAHAYVRYTSSTGNLYSWGTTRVEIAGYPQGIAGLTADEMSGAFMRAASTWSNANPDIGACSFLELHYTAQPASTTAPAAKYDSKNNIVVRADTWCSVDSSGVTECHDPSVLALTTVFARACGEIVDADIEVNAVNFAWANLNATAATAGKQDVQNALTHEMGHFIGLDHTCADLAGQPRPRDHTGAEIPDCASSPDAVRQTTMFPSADPGDVAKRTLAPDDIAGVCAAYPVGSAPRRCPPPSDAGADSGDAAGSGGAGGAAGTTGGSGGSAGGNDGGTTPKGNGGCGCRLARSSRADAPLSFLLALAFLAWPSLRRRNASTNRR